VYLRVRCWRRKYRAHLTLRAGMSGFELYSRGLAARDHIEDMQHDTHLYLAAMANLVTRCGHASSETRSPECLSVDRKWRLRSSMISRSTLTQSVTRGRSRRHDRLGRLFAPRGQDLCETCILTLLGSSDPSLPSSLFELRVHVMCMGTLVPHKQVQTPSWR
jgi:hypothetical protein